MNTKSEFVTVKREVLEQVVDAAFSAYCSQDLGKLVPALRAALGQPVQPKHKILTHREIDDLFPDGCYSLESIRVAERAILKKNGLLP